MDGNKSKVLIKDVKTSPLFLSLALLQKWHDIITYVRNKVGLIRLKEQVTKLINTGTAHNILGKLH